MKKVKQIFAGVIIVLSLLSCNKDDELVTPEPDVIDNPDPKPEPESGKSSPRQFFAIDTGNR